MSGSKEGILNTGEEHTVCWQLGQWQVFPQKNLLCSKSEEVTIEPKAMAVLVFLIRNQGKVVSTQRLLAELWPNVVVTDNTIRRTIAQLRKALKRQNDERNYIATVSKKGYVLVEKVQRKNSSVSSLKGIRLSISLLIVLLATAFYLWLVFTNNTNQFAWLKDAEIKPLTSFPGRELAPAISSGGDYLAFVHAEPEALNYNLYIQQLSSGKTQRLHTPGMSPFSPVWSPIDNNIAFTDLFNCRVHIANLSNDLDAIIHIEELFECGSSTLPQLSWSKDGRYLFINDQQESTLVYKQHLYDLQLKALSTLEFGETAPTNGFFKLVVHPKLPIWLLFSYNEKDQTNLWTYDVKTKQLRHLFQQNGFSHNASWCGEEAEIVFSTNKDLFAISIDGQNRKIAHNVGTELSYLSCDNTQKQIVFSDRNRNHSLVKSSLVQDDNSKIHIFRSTLGEENPTWSKVGKQIAFVTNKSGKWQVAYTINNDQIQYSKNSFSTPPEILGWSPNNGELLILSLGELGILNINSGELSWLNKLGSDISTANWANNSAGIYFSSILEGDTRYFDFVTQNIDIQFSKSSIFIAQNSDESLLYFTPSNKGGLWQFDLNSGVISQLTDSIPLQSRAQVFDRGLYFHSHVNESAGINYFDFETQAITPILSGGDIGHQFSISADESEVVYEVWDNYQADIKALVPHK